MQTTTGFKYVVVVVYKQVVNKNYPTI